MGDPQLIVGGKFKGPLLVTGASTVSGCRLRLQPAHRLWPVCTLPELGACHPRLLVLPGRGLPTDSCPRGWGPEPAGPAPCHQERGTRGRALLMSFHSPQWPVDAPVWGFLVCVCLPSAWGDGDMHISRGGNVRLCARGVRWGCVYTNGDSGTCGGCVYSKGLLVPFSV